MEEKEKQESKEINSKRLLSLAKYYYLVVNDRFELFYRGVVRSYNPYKYYIKATCVKGYTYNRYYTYTPKEDETGEYELTISLYDEFGNIIESAKTTLVVNKVLENLSEEKTKTILCIGDSLTCNGVWPYTGYKRYNEEVEKLINKANEEQANNNIETNKLKFVNKTKLIFVGKMKKEEVGFEGYGGWQWKTFCTEYNKSVTSSVWVNCNHHLDESDQHSKWSSNGLEWILETIEEKRLKFKRGENNNKVNPELGKSFTHVDHGTHHEEIIIDSYDYKEGNPFYNNKTQMIDFNYYLKENNFDNPDYVFILLTWNGQFNPYNKDFSTHSQYSQKMLRAIHEALPFAKIGLLGIQLPCCNGGITACYGASGYYHDWFGETITAFNYDEWLESLTYLDEYKDYVTYFDTKAQFDSEYNFYTKDTPVNNRSKIIERIGVNGIHPSMDGYLQIGDSFYRALIEQLKK